MSINKPGGEERHRYSGHTLMELVIVVAIFFLFLLGVYAALDMGMKTWQMGAVKSDTYLKARVALNNIVRDFSSSTWLSARIHGIAPGFNQYLAFETPVNSSTGTFQVNPTTGQPVWQGYIMYYVYQDYSDPTGTKKDLYRRFKPRSSPSTVPIPLTDAQILASVNTSIPSGEALRTIAKDIYSVDFIQNETRLVINICFRTNVRKEASVMFAGGFDKDLVNEVLEMKTSITPKN